MHSLMFQQFDVAAAKFKTQGDKVESLPQDKVLEIYALFKQGSVGDVNIDRPGMFDQKGRYKWDAWNGQKGKSLEEAQQQYIDLAKEILGE